MSTFSEYKNKIESYDPELFLGRLAWYSISEDSHIDHGKFCGTLVNNGLNEHLPPVPRPSDVFKRACTAAQLRNMPVDGAPLLRKNYLIREVGKDADNIWRRIVCEKVDTEGHSLAYTELAELHFHRPSSKISTKWLIEDSPDAVGIVDRVLDNFTIWNNSLTPYAIRELVRKILTSLNATVVRPSGGVYFVRETHHEKVEALESVIGDLPGGSSFHSLPLLDDNKQRAMLKAAFEDESIGQIDALLGEIGDLLKSGNKITSERFANFKETYDHLRKKVADYSDLLDEALVNTATRLEVMNDVLFKLLGQVKV